MKIAILENVPMVRDLLGNHLELEGHELIEYSSPQELISSLVQAKADGDLPGMLIVALATPYGLNGAEIVLRLRESIDANELPVVFIKGQTPEDEYVASKYLLDIPLLKVPIRKMDLTNKIHRIMKLKGD